MSIKKNDIINIEITAMSSEGSGVGRYEGMVIFVPASAIGDKLRVKILKTNKKHSFAKIEEIIEKSDARIDPSCEVFLKCGGCVYRHINYDEEARLKEQKVKDAIKRIGAIDKIEIEPILKATNSCRYRNKVQVPVSEKSDGGVCAGFFAPHSHRVIECNDCLLQPEVFEKIIKIILNWMETYKIKAYNESINDGLIRHIYIRYAEKKDELMVCVVATKKTLPSENELVASLKLYIKNLKTIIINLNNEITNVIMGQENRVVFGDGFITDRLCDLDFRISPLSFYQVNRDQAEKLYAIAKDYANLNKNQIVLDLYCGTGTVGLSMADKAKKIIGVEIIPQAINDARVNAMINNIKNSEFICSDATKAVEILKSKGIKPDVVILDPPRKGCELKLIEAVSEMNPIKVIYISCDPATLARDLNIFNGFKYTPIKATSVDLFPRTKHVETVCLLKKSKEISEHFQHL